MHPHTRGPPRGAARESGATLWMEAPPRGGRGGTTCEQVGSDRISEKPKSGEFCGLAKREFFFYGELYGKAKKIGRAAADFNFF